MNNSLSKTTSVDDCLTFTHTVLGNFCFCDDIVVEAPSPPTSQAPVGHAREATLVGSYAAVVPKSIDVCSPTAGLTRSAIAGGRRWLAADSGLQPGCNADVGHPSLSPANLQWDAKHQLWSWPYSGASPALACEAAQKGDSLVMLINDGAATRAAVGTCYGYATSPYLAVVGGRRTRDIVCLVDYDSRAGDCGSLVVTSKGVVGLHCGTIELKGKRYNAFYPFALPGVPRTASSTGGAYSEGARRQSKAVTTVHVRAVPVMPLRRSASPAPSVASRRSTAPRRESKARREGIVGMSAAPSDLLSNSSNRNTFNVQRYVDMVLNPWGSPALRLPDHVVTPTSTGRFFANRTYTIANTAVNGTNFLFGLNSRMGLSAPLGTSLITTEAPTVEINSLSVITVVPAYNNGSPGSILTPLQWGAGAYVDPHKNMYPISGVTTSVVWGDDFGASAASTVNFMSAYRVLSMAVRVRIVGLPTGQFMTPGKIYVAQVRYDHTDLPVTEQDFVTLEQLGRASHVSADAVRAAGSKTIYFTPDGAQKLNMTSNFIPAPGIFLSSDFLPPPLPGPPGPGVRAFPSPAAVTAFGGDFTRCIVPYKTVANTSAYAGGLAGLQDAQDSANADSSSLLFVAYFGAADGVVLEVDYAQAVEYIANKTAPGGIEAMVQLPNSSAMDDIFATAAVLTEAKPAMFQQPGDLSIVSSARGDPTAVTREAAQVKSRLTSMATAARGRAYREGFWDFDWLKKGNIGPVNWDFSDPAPAPAPPSQSTSSSSMRVRKKKPGFGRR